MAGRHKPKYEKKPFESTGVSKDVSANIYNSMVMSKAWQSLSARQQLLYVYCKMQYYSEKTKPNGDATQFNFNQAKWKEKYKLYTNNSQFYKDMAALIEKGFIVCIESGAFTRRKSIYQYSSTWQDYNEGVRDIPFNEATVRMQRGRLKKT